MRDAATDASDSYDRAQKMADRGMDTSNIDTSSGNDLSQSQTLSGRPRRNAK